MQFRVRKEKKVMKPVLTFVEIVGKLHYCKRSKVLFIRRHVILAAKLKVKLLFLLLF